MTDLMHWYKNHTVALQTRTVKKTVRVWFTRFVHFSFCSGFTLYSCGTLHEPVPNCGWVRSKKEKQTSFLADEQKNLF